MLQEARNDAMIVFFAASLGLISFMFLLVLDENFSAVKKDLLLESEYIDSQVEKLNLGWYELWETASAMNENPEAQVEFLRIGLSEIVKGDNIFYRIELFLTGSGNNVDYQKVPKVVVEDMEKYDRLNTFRNNLLSRDFSHIIRKPQAAGRAMKAYYTSPDDYQPILDLTTRYRFYALSAVSGLFVVFIIMYYGTFLPMRKVIKNLGQAENKKIEILPYPKTLIEKSYNRLAGNTIVQQIGLALSEWGTRAETPPIIHSKEGLVEIGDTILPLLNESGVFSDIWLLYGNSDASGDYEVVKATNKKTISLFEETDNLVITYGNSKTTTLAPTERVSVYECDLFVASLLINEQHPHGAIVGRKTTDNEAASESAKMMLAEVAKQIEQVISQVVAHHLRSERQKADISVALSTSMGHDLTNMIATSKWDIQTVQMYLKRMLPKLGEDRQAKIFSQALQGLLNNTQLLQEVVDLYRSLGLTKKPQYEFCDIQKLVDDAVNLFQFSTSKNVLLHIEHSGQLPELPVEPRLLKVAIFNLLSNSAQACGRKSIQLGEESGEYVGNILVKTEMQEEDKVAVEIRDNGTGFLDLSGRLLPKEQISRVFQSGYSTKTGRIAGGLGLNWAQTIIKDLHQGIIDADNVPTGGACIRLIIPIREMPEVIQENNQTAYRVANNNSE